MDDQSWPHPINPPNGSDPDAAHGAAPGAGLPPSRTNPAPPKPPINLLAVAVVAVLVVSAVGLGVSAVRADQRRGDEAAAKIAEQRLADARREGRSADVRQWRDWADLTCRDLSATSAEIETKLQAVDHALHEAGDAREVLRLLGDGFTLVAGFYRSWAVGLTQHPPPDQPDAKAQVQLYVAYFDGLAGKVQEFADIVLAVDLDRVTIEQATDIERRAKDIERSVDELPDAGDVYRGVDEGPVCKEVQDRVTTEV